MTKVNFIYKNISEGGMKNQMFYLNNEIVELINRLRSKRGGPKKKYFRR